MVARKELKFTGSPYLTKTGLPPCVITKTCLLCLEKRGESGDSSINYSTPCGSNKLRFYINYYRFIYFITANNKKMDMPGKDLYGVGLEYSVKKIQLDFRQYVAKTKGGLATT